MSSTATNRKPTCLSRVSEYFNLLNPHYWVFLILPGFLAAMVGWAIDEGVHLVDSLKTLLTQDLGLSWGVSYLIWVFFCWFFMMIAASIGEFVSKDAEGSGIPELKSILAGVNIYRYLSF